MENKIQKYLQLLNSEGVLKSPQEAGVIINEICECFCYEQSQFTVQLLVGLVLDENDGIFSFIWNTCSNSETVPSTTAAFKLLFFLVTNVQKCTEPYFYLIYEKCLYLLDVELAKVKETSLKLILILITLDSEITFDLSKLVSTFRSYLSEENKIPGTVIEKIYKILGYLFEKYPELVKSQEKWFYNKMIECLRHEIEVTKNVSQSAVRGAFEGINGYLINFEPPSESLKKLYQYIKNLSEFRENKKLLSLTALKIFQNHWTHFSKLICNDKEIWKKNLSVWLSKNSESRQCGFKCFMALYSAVAHFSKQNSKTIENYLQYFKEVLQFDTSNFLKKKLALDGIKLFVLSDCVKADDFKKLFNIVLVFTGKEVSSDSVFSLPSYIECLSGFIYKSSDNDRFNFEPALLLRKASVKLLENYPKINDGFQKEALISLEKSFYTLSLHDLRTLHNHIENILYQALVITFSCITVADLEIRRETGAEKMTENGIHTYKAYLSMWKYLLNLNSSGVEDSFENKKEVTTKVFDTIIDSFIKIISKLNLNVCIKSVNVEVEAEIEKPSDLQIFINCVDWYHDLVPLMDSSCLSKWLVKVFEVVIDMSRKNPLVAGFYKIITATLKVMNNCQFFEKDNKKLKCFVSLKNYMKEVLVNIDYYKGELQIFCLETLLAAPAILIESFIEKTIPVLIAAVQLGRNYSPLLMALVETLERWNLSLPSQTMADIMRKVLPYFDIFFQSQYFQGNNLVDSSILGKKLKKKLVFNDSEVLIFQKKFLSFLGRLDVNISTNLIELPETEREEREITDKRLIYLMPIMNDVDLLKTEVDLDEVLPRIIELASSCSDRGTRITACESLYSSVIFLLGNINIIEGVYRGLFKKIIRACLVLGCDSETVVREIFESLMVQITHYFSGKKAMHFVETQDLIDILVEYVTRPYDPTLRDFSAALISEFTTWSIRQLTPEELKQTPYSINKVIHKIFSLALHPSYNKRLGAAVIFNNIYSILREEDFILDSNWFQLFYYFMESLRMCDEAENTTEIKEAIQHVKRPLVERHEKFNQLSDSRIIPSEFEGGLLCHLIIWTLKRCSHEKTSTRLMAMNLVLELSPLVEDSDFLTLSFKKLHPQKLFLEKESIDVLNLKEFDFVVWLNQKSALFEYYAWLLNQNIVSLEDVSFAGFSKISKNYTSVILSSNAEKFFDAESSLHESIFLFLNLLLALKERSFYFPPEIWELIKSLVFKACRLGLNLYSVAVTQKFLHPLSDLLKYFSVNLTEYNWNYFYENLEAFITVPLLYRITRSRCLNNPSLEFLFALKVIQNSEIWEQFTKRTCFSIDGNDIFQIVFKSLFFKDRRKTYAVFLDSSCKLYLEELLTVASNLGIKIEQLLDLIENEEQVVDEETNKILKKGEYFLIKFESVILRVLKNQGGSLVERTLRNKTVNSIQFLIRIMRSKGSGVEDVELSREVFRRWDEFQKVDINENPTEREKMLLPLAICAAQAIGRPGCFKGSGIEERIYDVLENQKIEDMEVDVVRSFFILFSFMSEFEEKLGKNSRLEKGLCKFLIEQKVFENYSNRRTDDNFAKLGAIVTGLLNSLKVSGNLILFKFILTNASWFENVSEKEIKDNLIVFQKMSASHALNALTLAFNCCFEYEECKSAISDIYRLFLLPVMSTVPNEVKYQLVINNVEKLSRLITTRSMSEGKSLSEVRIDILRKICCVGILETFVKEVPGKELDKMPSEKKIFIDNIVKNCFSLLKEPPPVRALAERHRKLMCGVFNMICATISARCTEEKFYKYFVFDDRGSFLYEAIDKAAKYNLDMVFDEIPKRNKFLTSIRNSVKNNKNNVLKNIKYVQTNTLFTSSLCEDIANFDFTLASARTDSINVFDPQDHFVEVELEADSFNSHECMATLVAVVFKMVEDEITPLPINDDVLELPCWLQFFLKSLKNPELSANVKLFILKAMYNVQNYVQPFSRKIFLEILEFVFYFFEKYPLNYFLIDLIEMMTSWKPLPENEVFRCLLTNVMEMVISKSDSIRRDVVKFNLEIIKTMTENWKDVIIGFELSNFITKRVSEIVEFDRNTSDGLPYLYVHVCQILLSNGMPPWSSGSENIILEFILSHLNEENKHRQIFAETCGLALNYLQEFSVDGSEKYEKLVCDKINEISSWVLVLHAIHKRYPKISSRFTYKILISASSLPDSLLADNLEMLLSNFSEPEFPEDDSCIFQLYSFITDLLHMTDVHIQELCLQIVEKVFEKLKEENVKLLMKEVFLLQKSVRPEVRKWVYKIAIKYYPQSCADINEEKHCKIVLLKGLNDHVKELEDICFRFWKDFLFKNLSNITPIKVLQEMYMPETERISLSNTSKLLIESAEMINQREESVFSHPISRQSNFQKRSLILNTRGSYVPGFMSNKISKNQSLEQTATIKSQHTVFLRPTVTTFNFDPTLEENVGEATGDGINEVSESQTLRNPFKRRFYKSTEQTSFSFAKWRQRKEMERKEKYFIKKNAEVEIYGEYSTGDYPDIQRSHKQILKPLGALVKKDSQVGRQFLVSFYTGLLESVNHEEKKTLLSEMNKYFENIMETSTVFDSEVFGFALQFFLRYGDNFQIDCKKISNAAISSNWLFLGALVIEQIIVKAEDFEEELAKKPKTNDSVQKERWLELAKLYRNLEEYDIVSGIFLDKLNVQGDARKAIGCEAVLEWCNALKHYKSALEIDSDSLESEFYKESYFSCLVKLSDWSALNNCVRKAVHGNLDDLWSNFDLLSWFLKSEMMLSLMSDKNEFCEILKKFFESKGKTKFLSTNFGEELAVFDWISGKLSNTNYRIDRLYLDFLAGWSHLNRWSYNLRLSKVASLQTVSELSFAARTLADKRKSQMEQNFQMALRHWEKNVPAPSDDLTIWDTKLTYRDKFLKQLEDFDSNTIALRSNLQLAKTALSQNNFNIAKEYLSRAKRKLPENDATLVADYGYCFDLGKMVVAKLKMKDENEGLKSYLNVWQDIYAKRANFMETESEITRISLFRCNTILGQITSELLVFVSKPNVSPESISLISSRLGLKEPKVETLKNKGLEFFDTAREISENLKDNVELKSSAFLELAKFLLKFSTLKPLPDFEKLVMCILSAMKFGEAEARELFGCLLNMSDLNIEEASIERLTCEISSVPSWMFLLWINQILSGLNSKLFFFLKPIALQVTKDYPTAMWYPWKLNQKKYSSKNSGLCHFFEELNALLRTSMKDSSSRLYENFFCSMNYLGSPDLILRYHLENVLEVIDKENSNRLQINFVLTELYQLMFSLDYQPFRGPVFSYWNNFKSSIEELMKVEEPSVLKRKIENVLNSLKTTKLKRPFELLESYSPWLSNFHSLKEDAKIDIPGQYEGNRKPIRKYIFTITSFKNDILVFNSKCKPIRIAILGNDAKEHKFLIKIGEDLRQDQRIQQIFRHFNQRLKKNKLTKRFSVDTFKVIPLTFGLGMIEWIENNPSLQEMIENSLGNEADLIVKAQTKHLNFFTKNSDLADTEIVAAHLRAYEVFKRELAITNFNARVQEFPQGLLKKFFWNLSTSPEHFIYLRGNFATSYGVMCIMHWLLGIGDRHLQNTLVSTKTGRVLGIDFGYSFGFATRYLTPPELIPFRLTPQILALMEPLNESGLLKQAMIHCLRLFRRENFAIWSHLEVFALEPLMNWIERVKKDTRYNIKTSEVEHSKKDSSMIQKKLSGANPVVGIEADLAAGHSESNHLGKYLEVLKGVEQHNIRARHNREGLSEEEQVECLIDLATDPHILAKTYIGWNPWL